MSLALRGQTRVTSVLHALPPFPCVGCTPYNHTMDGPLKELAKLEKLTSNSSSKGKSPSINDSLDSLLESLREVKDRFQAGTATEDTLGVLSRTIEARKKDIDEKQKEIYNCLQRYGKALDKVRRYTTFLRVG